VREAQGATARGGGGTVAAGVSAAKVKGSGMAESRPVVGIDLGGTNIQIGVVSPDYKVVGHAKLKTKADDGRDAILDRIVEGIAEACTDAKIKPADLAAIGIGAPGAIDPTTGVVLEAVNLRWDNVPLAELLKKKTGKPVVVDNDVNVAVYGENKAGSGKNAENLLGVWVGTGIGGGLILNGRLYYGHNWTAGEIGHMTLFPGTPPGSRSLEHNCSRTALVDRLARLISGNRKSSIMAMVDGDVSRIKSRTIGKAFADQDPLTVEVVENSAHLLGVAIAGVVTLLSLPRVVLGGGLTEALGQPYVDLVQKSTRRHAFPDVCRKVDVVASKLEDHAGVLGAAMIACERLEEEKRKKK